MVIFSRALAARPDTLEQLFWIMNKWIAVWLNIH